VYFRDRLYVIRVHNFIDFRDMGVFGDGRMFMMSTHGHAVIHVSRGVVRARLDKSFASWPFGILTRTTKEQAIKYARSWAWRSGASSGEIHRNGVHQVERFSSW
jgi:hypothetical protein